MTEFSLGQGSGFSGEGGALGPDRGLGTSLGGSPGLLGIGDQNTERAQDVHSISVPYHPVWGCFLTSPSISCLISGGCRWKRIFLSAGIFPRDMEQSGTALATF